MSNGSIFGIVIFGICIVLWSLMAINKKQFRKQLKVGQPCFFFDAGGNRIKGKIASQGKDLSGEKRRVCIEIENDFVWRDIEEIEPETIICKKF